MATIQTQIQALLAVIGEEGIIERSNIVFNIEVTKPLVFSGEAKKIRGFIIVCRLYLRIKMRGCHMPSPLIQKIYLYGNTAPSTSITQAYLL